MVQDTKFIKTSTNNLFIKNSRKKGGESLLKVILNNCQDLTSKLE